MGAWFGIILLVIAALTLVMREDMPDIAGIEPTQLAMLVGALGLIVFAGTPIVARYKHRIGTFIRDLFLWGSVIGTLAIAFMYRGEIGNTYQRITGELVAPEIGIAVRKKQSGRVNGKGAVRVRRRPDGHFVARVKMNGVGINMIVDTGASTVVLKAEDARRIGISVDTLRYSVPVQTANGTTYAARIQLGDIFIGPVGIARVNALVTKPGTLHQSLLGMSFLSRLQSYEFSGDFLTLRS